MQNKKIDYNFETINPQQYKLTLNMNAESRLFDFIFTQAKTKLARKGISFKGDAAKVNRIGIEPKYFNLIKTALKKFISNICLEVAKDGIIVLNDTLYACYFIKKKEAWLIEVFIEGDYHATMQLQQTAEDKSN
jgi:hypothetical protein